MTHPLVTQLHFARSEFMRCLEGISDKDAPAWVDFQTRELNNGRLAMFGIMGELTHSAINGQGAIAGTMSTDGHYGLWYLSAASGNQY